jgi:hypothetical protein
MNQQRSRGSRPSLPSPSTGTLGAAVAVVALVLGFLILRDVRGDGGTASVVPVTDPTEQTTPDGGSIDPNAPTTTVAFAVNGFKIQVANASGVAGSAGDLTLKLQDQGYVVQKALNVAAGTAKRQKTGVFYSVGCEAASQNVAAVLGGNVEVGAMPNPVPVETATVGEACILILLGTDLASKPLAGVVGTGNGQVVQTTTTTVAPAAG